MRIRNLVNSYPIAFLLLLAFCLRIFNFSSPILGVHSWRQADTAAIARNFYENGYNFWYPQVDWGGNLTGYCQTEFPIYSFLIAILYKFLGIHESIGRLVSIVFSLITIYFLYKLCLEITKDQQLSFWSSFFYTIIPTNIYYSRTFQPESFVLMTGLSGIYFFYKWLKTDQKKYFYTSLILVTLACLVKVVPAFYLSLPMIFLAWQRFDRKMFFNLNLWFYFFVVLISTLIWYLHSFQVGMEYGLTFGFGAERFGWNFQRLGITFEQIIYFIAVRHLLVLGFIVMIFGVCCKRKNQEERFFDVFLISTIGYILIFANLNSFHEYYQLPFLIPASIYLGKAFIAINNSSKFRRFVPVGLVIFLSIASIFYSYEYMAKEVPQDSDLFELAQIVKQKVPKDSLIIATTGGDPTILYLSHHKGWVPSPEEVTKEYLSNRVKDRAEYFLGGYNFVQTWQTSMPKVDRERIQGIVSGSQSKIIDTKRFFLIKL